MSWGIFITWVWLQIYRFSFLENGSLTGASKIWTPKLLPAAVTVIQWLILPGVMNELLKSTFNFLLKPIFFYIPKFLSLFLRNLVSFGSLSLTCTRWWMLETNGDQAGWGWLYLGLFYGDDCVEQLHIY